ncbi:hypothetical protein D3C81_2200020 [compost metagenome]
MHRARVRYFQRCRTCRMTSVKMVAITAVVSRPRPAATPMAATIQMLAAVVRPWM